MSKIARCKDCGYILEIGADQATYCPMCKARRHRDPPEIDPQTGEWEGITHGNR